MSGGRVPASEVASRLEPAEIAQFAADVQYYLAQSPRQLPSRYLYDALGSALFEAICRLPWYRITRAEERLLARHGRDIFRRVCPSQIVELGSGSGEKLRILLETRDADAGAIDVHLIDVSAAALEASARALQPFEDAQVTAHRGPYEEGLGEFGDGRAHDDRVLVLFLGSNIGNYDPPDADAFLLSIRSRLRIGDALLLGTDLVKPERDLQLAYDDPLGVTAAFNRNLLVRINRELGGNFDVNAFAHRAVWNDAESRVEMHLVARRHQNVHIEAAEIEFAMRKGERIWTESSYKYRPNEVSGLLEAVGFTVVEHWVDRVGQFALTLVQLR